MRGDAAEATRPPGSWAAAEHETQTLKRSLSDHAAPVHEGQAIELEKLKQHIERLQAPRQMLRALPGAIAKRVREKIDDLSGIASSLPGFHLKIDDRPASVQNLRPEGKLERFEGLAFSTSGNVLGVATANTNAVLLYRKAWPGAKYVALVLVRMSSNTSASVT